MRCSHSYLLDYHNRKNLKLNDVIVAATIRSAITFKVRVNMQLYKSGAHPEFFIGEKRGGGGLTVQLYIPNLCLILEIML